MHGNRPITQVLLSYAPLFEGMGEAALNRIAQRTEEIRLSRHGILFGQGTPCEGFHLVVHGQVKLSFSSAQGVERIIDILAQDATYGEALMLAEQPYMAKAEALADSLVLHIPREAILEEFEASPQLRLRLLKLMSGYLHGVMAGSQAFSQQSGAQRFINYLLRQLPDGARNGKDVFVPLPTSKGNIASQLNLTREHFSRVLRTLTEQGLISTATECRILVPDLARLVACLDEVRPATPVKQGGSCGQGQCCRQGAAEFGNPCSV